MSVDADLCAPNKNAHAIPFFMETKILPVNMIYFDTVANLMHDIWKGQAPLPIRAFFTKSSEIHGYNTRHAAKGNYYQKEAKLEQYGTKFLQIGEMHLNQFLRK